MPHFIIRNGRLIDPVQSLDSISDIEIKDDRIVRIGDGLDTDGTPEQIDARNKWVVPGLIDMHVHLREPGREDEETIDSGCKAAASGGFTAVACMANTQPVNDNQTITRFILEQAAKSVVRVYPIAAISRDMKGQELTDMGELIKAGAVAFSDDGLTVRNGELLRRAFEYAKMFDRPLIEHCEDPDLAAGGVMNESTTSTRLGLAGIPSIAEEIIVARDILIAAFTGGSLHIAHASTQGTVQLIRQAKTHGVRITAEATPHHLFLNDEAVASFDTNLKMSPPLRTEKDRQALLEGLLDGTIDCVASDHAPHAVHEKDVEFSAAPNGVIGLETSLPLVLTRLVHSKKMTPSRMVEVMSSNPAKILRVPGGSLRPGELADITVIDPERYSIVDPMHTVSRSRNTPFKGWTLRGSAEKTIVSGRIVFDAESAV